MCASLESIAEKRENRITVDFAKVCVARARERHRIESRPRRLPFQQSNPPSTQFEDRERRSSARLCRGRGRPEPSRPGEWRRGRDSNPRNPCGLNGFRDRPDRPLRHLSAKARGRESARSARSARLPQAPRLAKPCPEVVEGTVLRLSSGPSNDPFSVMLGDCGGGNLVPESG